MRINKKELSKALALGGFFAGKNKVLYEWDNVEVRVHDQELSVTSFDGENLAQMTIPIDNNFKEEFAIRLRKEELCEYLLALDEDTISFAKRDESVCFSHEMGEVYLPAQRSTVSMPDLTISMGDSYKAFTIKKGVFFKSLTKAMPFVGQDAMKPIMLGVNFSIEESDGAFIISSNATDTKKAYHGEVELDTEACAGNFTLPPGIFPLMKKILSGDADGECKVFFNNDNIVICCDNIMVKSILIKGDFPTVKLILNNFKGDNVFCLKVLREPFLEAAKRCHMTSAVGSDILTMTIKTTGKIEFLFKDTLTKSKVKSSVSYSSEKKIPSEIQDYMSVKDLIIALQAADGAYVDMSLQTSRSPILFSDKTDKAAPIVMLMPKASL